MIRKISAALLALALFPLATAQTYDTRQNTQVVQPILTVAPFTLSTACSTPLTPVGNCASTSYQIIPVSGGAELSLQISAINGAVISFYSSDDDVNFVAQNFSGPATAGALSPISATSSAGKFVAGTTGAAYVEVAMTTVGSAAVTVTPALSQHNAAVSIHSSINLPMVQPSGSVYNVAVTNATPSYVPVLPAPSATFGVYTLNATPSPYPTDSSGRQVISPNTLPTIDSLGRLTTTPVGCGADAAFPTSISTSGTSLGTPPACAKGVEMDVPPGATVAYYVAQSGLGSSAAAVAVSHQYANASSSLQPLPVQVNLSNSQLVFVTYVVAGTSGTYISGLPTFRWI